LGDSTQSCTWSGAYVCEHGYRGDECQVIEEGGEEGKNIEYRITNIEVREKKKQNIEY
jgi:hypothetical protein